MAVSAGPDIVENGLLLNFDSANFKSFKGEPTTNLITDPLAVSGFPSPFTWSGFEATSERVSNLPDPYMGNISPFWIKLVKTSATNGRAVVYGGGGLNTGVDYCRSFYVYTNDINLSVLRWQTDNATVSTDQSWTTYTPSDIGKIKRVQTVFRSVSGNAVDVLRFGPTDPIGTTVWITGIQIEQKSYPTKIVSGTRGTTVATGGGLANLIENSKNGELLNGIREDLNNFGSIIFDGIDDYIQINHDTTLNSLPLTMNAWIYMESGASGIDIINKYVSGSVNGYRMGIVSGGLGIYYFGGSINDGLWPYDSYSGTINFSQWNMVTATIDSSGGILYINGNQVGTRYWNGSALAPSTTNPLRIGTYNLTNGYFNGKIASVKIYNRALSSQEITQNFNALRGRFGL